MENKKQDKGDVNSYISRIVKPIFEKVAQEARKNHMMVGGMGDTTNKYCLYNPHNYRLYFDYNKKTFEPETIPKSVVRGLLLVEHNQINKTEHIYKNFLGCAIRVKKNSIEVINTKKRWYRIPLHIDKIRPVLAQITQEKDRVCRLALKEFIRIYGGFSQFKVINRVSENKIQGEDIIDLLPIKQKWHNEVVKKVYNEKNVEFSDAAFASNYLRTRATEDKADSFDKKLDKMADSLSYIAKNYESHVKLVAQSSNLLKLLNKRLSQRKLNEFL